jgi:hypothetical protein
MLDASTQIGPQLALPGFNGHANGTLVCVARQAGRRNFPIFCVVALIARRNFAQLRRACGAN